MITFSGILPPLFGAVVIAALLAAIAYLCHEHRPPARRPPSRFRRWLRFLWRYPVYKLTRRMPGKCPKRDPYRLSGKDRAKFGAIAIGLAEEPQPRSERRER